MESFSPALGHSAHESCFENDRRPSVDKEECDESFFFL